MNFSEWHDQLNYLLNEKKREITYRNSSASSRRIQGQFGSDRKFYGFRTALLYFQLNPNLDLNHLDVNNILALIERYTDPGKTGMRRFSIK